MTPRDGGPCAGAAAEAADAVDSHGAYVPGPRCHVAPTGAGALDGLRLAVKDLIDVAGWVTGGGNPDWARGREPAARHATAVERLLHSGAAVGGKTITDELAFSLEGENWHYGTPRNPRSPDCLPGGSSSGSAVAVAAGLVDFALGTDTGGSVRVPAAFCGVYGMRPSHGAIPLRGVLPFAPGYDTVGWFARSAALLEQVGAVLLGTAADTGPADADAGPAPRLIVLDDVYAMTEPALAAHLRLAASSLGACAGMSIFEGRAQDWLHCYQVLQGVKINDALGDWLASARPRFGPAIAPRFAALAALTDDQALEQLAPRTAMRQRLKRLLQPGVVLVLPTTPTTALPLDADGATRGAFYASALAINAIAGHAGLPQVTVPAGSVAGRAAGLSFIAARGSDLWLLRQVRNWAALLDQDNFTMQGNQQ